MGLITDFRDFLKAKRNGEKMTFQGAGGGDSTAQVVSTYDSMASWDQAINRAISSFYGGTRIDYASELGDLSLSSMVAAAARWVSKNLNDAMLEVATIGADQKETPIENHPLPGLWRRPNPFYSGQTLIRGFAVSWIANAAAYILIIRDRTGNPIELWYEPHATIRPRWPADGSELISHYQLRRDGKWTDWPMENVFAVYDNFDPVTRSGNNGLTSLLKDIYTDEQSSRFTAQLLKNGLVPPVIFSVGDKERPFTGDKAVLLEIEDRIKRKMSGDRAGEPIVTNDAITAQKLGFDYSATGMKETREVSEARFCAVVGISAESLRFGVAAKHSTYNNVREHRVADYQDYIMPLHSLIAQEMDTRFLPDFGPEGSRVQFNYDRVQILQPDRSKETERTVALYRSRIIDQAEAREREAYKSEATHKGVYYPVPSSNITISPIAAAALEPTEDEEKPLPPVEEDDEQKSYKRDPDVSDADADDAGDWWKRTAPEGARDLIDAEIKPGGSVS